MTDKITPELIIDKITTMIAKGHSIKSIVVSADVHRELRYSSNYETHLPNGHPDRDRRFFGIPYRVDTSIDGFRVIC